jgi:hypothetical protein
VTALPYVANRPKFAANVAGLASLIGRKTTGDLCYVAGYHAAGDGGDQLVRWADGDTTTADGGFVHSATGGRWHAVDKAVADARKFGASPSATAEDNDAAFAAASAAATANAIPLVIPGGVYDTSDTLTVEYPAYLRMAADAEISYAGSGTAISLVGCGNAGTDADRVTRDHKIGRVINSAGVAWDAGTDTTSCGVKIDGGFWGDRFYVGSIRNFFDGLYLPGVDEGAANCHFTLGRIVNNKRGVHLASSATGYVNQCQFHGGQIRIDGAYTNSAGRKGIYLEAYSAETNGHIFVGCNLEGTSVERMIDCAGDENYWIACRFEGATAGRIYFASGAEKNRVLWGTGAELTFFGGSEVVSNNDSADTTRYNVVDGGRYRGTKALAFDGTSILMGNGTADPTGALAGYSTDRIYVGKSMRCVGVTHYEDQTVTSGSNVTATANVVRLNYGGATNVNNLFGVQVGTGVSGLVALISIGSTATIKHVASGTGNIVTPTAADVTMTANKPYLFCCTGGTAYLVSTP